jgi:DNA-binding transcriptional LysR family regulator
MTLEREVGVQLIDRSKRPLQLTASGETFHHGCRQILDNFERLRRQIAEPDGVTGKVRVAAIYSAGIDLLNQAAQSFEAANPGCKVELQYQQPMGVYDRVRADQVDVGIISYPDRWRDVASQPLRDETMVVVCRPDHHLADRPNLTPIDLAEVPLVSFDASLPIHRRIAAYLRSHGVTPLVAHSFDNIDTLKVYLAHSTEAAILPDRTVAREVNQGTLAATPLTPTLVRPVAVVFNRHRQLTPAVQTFIEHLTQTSTEDTAKHTAAVSA